MKRIFEETLKYDTFGAVKIRYEFAGDVNESDFDVFKKKYLNKSEVDVPKLNNYPKTFVTQAKETLKEWGVRWA